MEQKTQDDPPYSSDVLELDGTVSEIWHNYFISTLVKAAGQVTLVAGVATVKTPLVNGSSIIMVSRASLGSGVPYSSNITPGESFEILSSDAGDTGIINWMLIS